MMLMSELWRSILNKDIQESKITTGDAYRIASSLSELESQLSIEKQRREKAESFINRAREFQDGGVNIARWSVLMKEIAAYDEFKSQSHEK
jgi:hypothetical protein